MKYLLFLCLIAISCSCKAQFFGPRKPPYPGGKFALSAIAPDSTHNFFKPVINVSATFSNGASAAGGVGIQWQHDKADPASNTWVIQYSVSALAWLTVNANKVSGVGGVVVSIPGTAGMLNLGGGRDFTAGQWVAITGVNIPIP